MTAIPAPRRRLWRGAVLLLCAAAGGCAAPKPPPAPVAGDPAELVISDDARASAAGLEMLKRGGSATDAAIAAQAVLGLVEPQASGFGGGSVLLIWQADRQTLDAIDGTPRAGRNAAAGLNADASGQPLDPASVIHGPGAAGVPGTLPALWLAHQAHGRLPWATLFEPAIKLARDGFAMPRALHDLLASPGAPPPLARLFGPGVPPAGAAARNPDYAATLQRVARLGPPGLWAEGAGAALMAALSAGPHPSRLTLADFDAYAATRTEALCMGWLDWKLCTAPPPAFGGLVALQTLAMAGPGNLSDVAYTHRFLEAGRLAEADRRRYAADPDRVRVPAAGMLDASYLAGRAAAIEPNRALARPRPGNLPLDTAALTDDPGQPTTATSQIVAVARPGDAVTLTSSLTYSFGAQVVAAGVVLNNALVDFSPLPPSGVRYANQMAPGKRPATPKAPVMAFDAQGRLVLLGGSGGGPFVPDVVAAALNDMLPGKLPPAQALARGHVSAADIDHIAVEQGTPAADLLPALQAMGHTAAAEPMASGSAFARRSATGWLGAADPRRDGVALGD